MQKMYIFCENCANWQIRRMKRSGCYATIGVLVVLFLMTAPPAQAASPVSSVATSGAAAADSPVPAVTCLGNCTLGNLTMLTPTGYNATAANWTGYPISSDFWGTTVTPRAHVIPGESSLLGSTTTRTIVWPGANAGDYYNPLNGSLYTEIHTYGKHGRGYGHQWTNVSQSGTSEAEFVQFCESINCTAIFQVPAMNDNASFAAEIVNYTEKTLDFHPAYWEIGNEPQLWHWTGVPMQDWPIGNGTIPTTKETPLGYALLVQKYIAYMRTADPHIKIIGLPAAGRPDPQPVENWIAPVVAIDGPNISGVAYHDYPAGTRGPGADQAATLQNYYGAINGKAGLPMRMLEVEGGVDNGSWNYATWYSEELGRGYPLGGYPLVSACSLRCAENLSIFVTEFGTALDHQAYGHFSDRFEGALNYAGQVIEALDDGDFTGMETPAPVVNIDLFGTVFDTNNSWVNLSGGVRPSYTLFSEILDHLGTTIYRVNLSVPDYYTTKRVTDTFGSVWLGNNLYAIATVDHQDLDRSDLLTVNLNATTGVGFAPWLPGIDPGTPTEVWSWQGVVSNPGDNWVTATVNSSTPNPVPEFFPHGLPSSWTLPPQSVDLFEAFPGGGVPVQFTARSGSTNLSSAYSGLRWYVNVGGDLTTANNSSNVTVFLPDGVGADRTFSLSSLTIPINNSKEVAPGNEPLVTREELVPALPSSVSVAPAASAVPETVSLKFSPQWLVLSSVAPFVNTSSGSTNVTLPPGPMGFATESSDWGNATDPVTLTAYPAFHYAFVHWQGFGRGDNNSSDTQISVSPTTWVSEKALFAWGYPVILSEVGLPSGTSWSVSVRSHFASDGVVNEYNNTYSSTTNAIGFEEANGTYGFRLDSVPGYRASLPGTSFLTNSSFTVQSGAVFLSVNFTLTTPPAPRYLVSFVETGLASGTPWWITTRNVTTSQVGNQTNISQGELTETSSSSTMAFYESAGAYGYTALSIPGMHARPPSDGYNVTGPGVIVPVEFAVMTYEVIWEESGLGANLSWSVDVSNSTDGSVVPCVGAWTVARLANGSYSYSIPTVADHIPSLQSGSFTVQGADIVFDFEFPPAAFPVAFDVQNLPRGGYWDVRFSNLTENLTGASTTFAAPNGSYTFDVVVPTGYLASPSHGTIDVSVSPAGLPPVPPIWDLATPALAVAGIVALVAAGTLLLGRRRRRGRSGGTS
jgi:hypothetical protein